MFKTYILILKLKRNISIPVGILKTINFKKGYYAYIGSGKRKIISRISRHIKEKKKIFWHIDYLTTNNNFKIQEIYLIKNLSECELSKMFYSKNISFIEKFGSSDCFCNSHLYYFRNLKDIKSLLKSITIRRFYEHSF
ncbi:MAG: GIY-YIG nuclease family protein [Caldisericia bacterium]|nr:GIY-YIG nuclease family protein [Caldisericia bacterium]